MKTIKELCTEYGLGQTELARRFDIPVRTIQNWHAGVRNPPDYVVRMMDELLSLEAAEKAHHREVVKSNLRAAANIREKAREKKAEKTVDQRCANCGNAENYSGFDDHYCQAYKCLIRAEHYDCEHFKC